MNVLKDVVVLKGTINFFETWCLDQGSIQQRISDSRARDLKQTLQEVFQNDPAQLHFEPSNDPNVLSAGDKAWWEVILNSFARL